jgi:high-affinity nickel-transport protein
MVHGMAGSGALMLAVLSTINSLPLGLGYIAIFGAGSILSMMGISTMIGLPFVRAKKYVRLSVLLRYLTGITSLVIGVRLMYDLGVVQQIFIK